MYILYWLIYLAGCITSIYLLFFGEHSINYLYKDAHKFITSTRKKSKISGFMFLGIALFITAVSILGSWIGVFMFFISYYIENDK